MTVVRFFAKDHQYKGKAYIAALQQAGFTLSRFFADFYLLDHDCNNRPEVAEAIYRGKPVLLFQHAARPPVQWDGHCVPSSQTIGHFVYAPGHLEVMRAYGFDRDIWITGWPHGKVRQMKPVSMVRKVTFAPIHPGTGGFLPEEYKRRNQEVFEALLSTPYLQITIRYLDTLEANGLERVHNKAINYVKGKPGYSTVEMDWADLVIGAQTYAYNAIARGIPTVMCDQDLCPLTRTGSGKFVQVKHWAAYRELWHYEHDFIERSLEDHFRFAIKRSSSLDYWKQRFIGKPMKLKDFAALTNNILVNYRVLS